MPVKDFEVDNVTAPALMTIGVGFNGKVRSRIQIWWLVAIY